MTTYSVRLLLRKDKISKKTGRASIGMVVGLNSQYVRLSTGIKLLPTDWDENKTQVRRSHPDHNALNIELRDNVARVNAIFDEYRRARIDLTPDMFRQAYAHPSSREDFVAYLELSISRRIELGEITESTAKQHKVVWRKLLRWRKVIRFSEINQRLLDEFDIWHLAQLRKRKGDNLTNQGQGPRSNAWKVIKTYLLRARLDHIQFEMPQTFRTKQHAPEADFLTRDEVKRLQLIYDRSDLYPDHWKEILRLFLWMCFTGQSFVDAQAATWEQVRENVLTYTRQKGKRFRKQVVVPLCPAAIRYLPDTDSGRIFRKYENQYFNRELKKIAKRGKIQVRLSAKVARDTFGTLFCEAVGGDVFTLMELMGHSNIETTRKYVHLSQGHKTRQIQRAFEDF